MDNTMTGRAQADVAKMIFNPKNQMLEQRFMRNVRAFFPPLFIENFTAQRLDDEMRCGVNPLNLAFAG